MGQSKQVFLITCRRLLLASLSAGLIGMFLACGGSGSKSPQEVAAEAKVEDAKKREAAARTPEQVKAANEAREEAEAELKEAARAAADARKQAEIERELAEIERDLRKITLEKYYKIQTGMTYDEVYKIAGVHGEERSRVDLGGPTTACISWKNDDGSNMLLTFQGGRLVGKAQAGLRPESRRVREAKAKVEAEAARQAEAKRETEAKQRAEEEARFGQAKRETEISREAKAKAAEEQRKTARAEITRVKEDPAYRAAKAEFEAARKLKYARQLARTSDQERFIKQNTKEADRQAREAKQGYEQIVKTYPGTKAAADAQELLSGKEPPDRPTSPDPDDPKSDFGKRLLDAEKRLNSVAEWEKLLKQFVGQWRIVDEKGATASVFTLTDSFSARKSHVPTAAGTWEIVRNEARITWSDGWKDVLRPQGGKIQKLAFGPGTSWDDPPANTQRAVKDRQK